MVMHNAMGGMALDATLQTRASESSLASVKTAVESLDAKTPDLRTDFMAGRVRTAGGQQAIAGGATGAFRLANPSGSGKVITVANFMLATDMVASCTFWFDSTLAGTPTTITAFNPNRAFELVPGQSTAGQASRSATGRSGGTQLSPVYLLPNSIPVQQDFPVVLLPGMAVVVAVTAAALANMNLYVTCTWSEDPA